MRIAHGGYAPPAERGLACHASGVQGAPVTKTGSVMTHTQMQIIVAAILASGGVNTTGPDHTVGKVVSRFKEVLEEVQKSGAIPPLR